MRLALAAAAAAALPGCAAEGRDPAGMPPPPVRLPCALGADDGRAHGFRMALDAALDAAAAAGPHAIVELFAESGGSMTDLFGLATRRDPVRVETVVTCPDAPFLLGRGLVTDLVVGVATAVDRREWADGEDGGLRSVALRGAYADWSDGWRVHLTPPRDAFADMRVHATRAEVWVSLARRWATVEVTLLAVGHDDRLVLSAPPLEVAVREREAPLHRGFRLVAASRDGRPADLVLGAGGYLVICGVGKGPSQIRLRYEGPLPLVGENQAEARVLELHRWLPTVPFAPASLVDVTVHHPADEALVLSLPHVLPSRAAPAPGWRVERRAGHTDRDPSLLLLEAAPAVRVWDDGRGSRIELWATPPAPLAACAPALERIVAALAPLGPVGHVRVVAVPAIYGRHGRRADDLVILLAGKLVDLCSPVDEGSGPQARRRHAEAIALVAHELAHGWFGRTVRAADDEASAWWEAAAEYVSSWAVDEPAALALRRGWADDYAEAAHRDVFAMAQRIPTAGSLRDALSYAKGALLFSALEARIGRDRVAAVLRHLVHTRAGALGSWLDLVAATHEVAGSAAAAWLHGWLVSVGAPDLAIAEVRRTGRRVAFTILQRTDPPFPVTLDVALLRGEELVLHARVPVHARRTPVTLDLPAGADRIAVDPWYRLPRHGIAEAAIPR
jgi:hypothetical protein